MIITIAKINRKEAISKKNNKPFQQLGIAPVETTLTDINGDTFSRDDRWISGFGKVGVTDDWAEGDKVKINLIRVTGKKRDGSAGEFINFRLPEGVNPMVEKFNTSDEIVTADPDDF